MSAGAALGGQEQSSPLIPSARLPVTDDDDEVLITWNISPTDVFVSSPLGFESVTQVKSLTK